MVFSIFSPQLCESAGKGFGFKLILLLSLTHFCLHSFGLTSGEIMPYHDFMHNFNSTEQKSLLDHIPEGHILFEKILKWKKIDFRMSSEIRKFLLLQLKEKLLLTQFNSFCFLFFLASSTPGQMQAWMS